MGNCFSSDSGGDGGRVQNPTPHYKREMSNGKNSVTDPGTVRLDFPSESHRPLPAPPTPGATVVRAIYDYKARVDDDLSFRKGDKMEIIGDSENCDWWHARHLANRAEGYIPSNYVVKDDNNPESQEWWFKVRFIRFTLSDHSYSCG